MPLTAKGEKILANLKREYGSDEKAKEVLYAGKNKGTFTGIDDDEEFKVGERVHLGFGAKGGAGFFGVITKIEGGTVHIKNPEGKTYSGPLRLVSKDSQADSDINTNEFAKLRSDAEEALAKCDALMNRMDDFTGRIGKYMEARKDAAKSAHSFKVGKGSGEFSTEHAAKFARDSFAKDLERRGFKVETQDKNGEYVLEFSRSDDHTGYPDQDYMHAQMIGQMAKRDAFAVQPKELKRGTI